MKHSCAPLLFFFFFNDTATTEIYTLSLHDALPILAICNGLRPRVAKGTPKCYIDLVNQCLDANPEKRPSSTLLLKTIRNWQLPNNHYSQLEKSFKKPEMSKEFIYADNIILHKSSSEITIHSEAIYTG